MKKPLKTKTVEYMDFWNDDYDIRIYFKEKEAIEPEPILPDIPTVIKLSEVAFQLPEIPSNIKANYINNLN